MGLNKQQKDGAGHAVKVKSSERERATGSSTGSVTARPGFAPTNAGEWAAPHSHIVHRLRSRTSIPSRGHQANAAMLSSIVHHCP
jgi:hypothetical protein